jgi:hypothetical protein
MGKDTQQQVLSIETKKLPGTTAEQANSIVLCRRNQVAQQQQWHLALASQAAACNDHVMPMIAIGHHSFHFRVCATPRSGS